MDKKREFMGKDMPTGKTPGGPLPRNDLYAGHGSVTRLGYTKGSEDIPESRDQRYKQSRAPIGFTGRNIGSWDR